MIIKNQDHGGWGYIESIDSSFQLTHSALVGGTSGDWDVGHGYEINRTLQVYNSSHTVYPSIMDVVISTAAGSTNNAESITYASTFTVTVRVRAGSTGTKIVPFVTEGEVTSGGFSVSAVRQTDAVASTA